MAIGTPVSLGTVTATGSAATQALTVTAAVSVGDTIVAWAWRNLATTGTTFSDSKGNTWQVDVDVTSTNGAIVQGSCQVTNALTTSDTITATFPSSAFTVRDVMALKVSGLATTVWYEDKSATFDSGFTTSFATTAKANVQADALLLGVVQAGAGKTYTSSAPWTQLLNLDDTSNASFGAQYQIVSTVASRSTAMTPSSGAAGIAVMSIYKADLGGGGGGFVQPLPIVGSSYAAQRAATI